MNEIGKTEKLNSHVILNRGVIKNFVANSNEGKLFTLNLKSLEIEKKPAVEIGIVQNYFSKDVEEYFSGNYETKLGRLIKLLNENRDYHFDESDTKFIKAFFVVLLYRNPCIIDKIMSYASNKYICNESNSSYIPGLLSRLKIDETFLDNFYVDVLFNDSSLGFISSTIGYGGLPNREKENEIFFIPLTPKISICLVNEKDFNDKTYIKKYAFTNDDIEQVKNINCFVAGIAKTTYKLYKHDEYDIYYLIGNNKDELERIKKIIENEIKR